MEIPPGLIRFGKRLQEQTTDGILNLIVSVHDFLYPEEETEEAPAKIVRRKPIPGTLLTEVEDEDGNIEIEVRFDWESYKSWDTIHRFPVMDAISLWTEVSVDTLETDCPERWHLMKNQLVNAIVLGGLTLRVLPPASPVGGYRSPEDRKALLKLYGGDIWKPHDGDYQNINLRFAYVDRDDFYRYALSIGERPLFLFKGERKGRLTVTCEQTDENKEKTGEEVTTRAHARKKKEALRIAREMWANDETLTVVAIFNSPEIQSIRKENGEPYTEDTIRDWIKELNPDRSPGRRPKKK